MAETKLLFTDLDGTFLDHHTYVPGPAADALEAVCASGITVFFCSSKTLPEQAALARRLGCGVGFIVENGGLASLPRDAGTHRFGTSYDSIRSALAVAASESEIAVTGYGDLSPEEISAVTGLSVDQADLAARRCCSETLVGLSESDAATLGPSLAHHGLRLQRGGRFWSVQGEHDKGSAIGWVIDQFSSSGSDVVSYGIGDGPNDESMLRRVDQPMLVRSHDGTWSHMDVPGLRHIDGIGPVGWVLAAAIVRGHSE